MAHEMTPSLAFLEAAAPSASVERDHRVSQWFSAEDIHSGVFDDLHDEYVREFESLVAAASSSLGKPDFNDGMGNRAFPEWYEAEFLAYWRASSGFKYLALKHDDQETPLAIVYGFRHEP